MKTSSGTIIRSISNYAKQGFECQHNINYWQNGSYLGLGPGAVSYVSGQRVASLKDVEVFYHKVAEDKEWWSDTEELTHEERFRETVIMGLRMVNGLSIREFENRFKINLRDYYGETLEDLVLEGLLQVRDDHIMLSTQGMMLANQVLAKLV